MIYWTHWKIGLSSVTSSKQVILQCTVTSVGTIQCYLEIEGSANNYIQIQTKYPSGKRYVTVLKEVISNFNVCSWQWQLVLWSWKETFLVVTVGGCGCPKRTIFPGFIALWSWKASVSIYFKFWMVLEGVIRVFTHNEIDNNSFQVQNAVRNW